MQNSPTNPKPSARAEVVTARTYSRPLEGGRAESWDEIVKRVLSHQRWLWQRALGDKPLNSKQEDELEDLREILLNREACVSGRTLWLGGTNVAKTREASMFNPLKRTEKFITSNGVMSFEDFEDGDEVTVLTHLGRWKSARVGAAGVRSTLKLGLRRGRSTAEIISSEDHTWILSDGVRVKANELVVGDKIWAAPDQAFYAWDFDAAPADEQLWWCYGFVYGDGALAKSSAGMTSRVRLCGSKVRHLDKFKACGFGYSYPPSTNGDPFVYTGNYQKTLPDDSDELRLIGAFLRGYLAADGSKKNQRGEEEYRGIFASDPEAVHFLRKYLPAIGLYILAEKNENVTTNYGVRKGTLFSLSTCQGNLWKIESIDAAGMEDCWCLTVETDHSFVLPTGIVSGNCAFTKVETTHDVVDAFWLLLQGCGVGFEPVVGTLNGFTQKMEIEVIRSQRHLLEQKRGRETNTEALVERDGKRVWHVTCGDSAEAWAKFVGKVLAGKQRADVLVLDFSQIRPPGERLKGYGWLCSGDETFAPAIEKICGILNKKAGELLDRLDIMDILNHLGTTLSSRRSAEIALVPYGDPEWQAFATAKKDFWLHDNHHRQQSNNSLVFKSAPSLDVIAGLFNIMQEAGGSEPGFVNGVAAKQRAKWFSGLNPCAEILLPNKGFCNLVEINLSRFNGNPGRLWHVARIMARANYRQTCVNLVDGVLQRAWHENNEFLRLCGVGVTGVVQWEMAGHRPAWDMLKRLVKAAANSMADELGLPHPKAVTTVKPSGTLSKIMDTTEGVHKPLGRYIFNNIRFGVHDPLLKSLEAANYRIIDDPSSPDAKLVTFPVEYSGVEFDNIGGVDVNTESAVNQLERYKLLMQAYVDHNCSVTVSYSPEEVPQIVEWLYNNWDLYVGVSFLYRTDPTKTAKDLGYLYLPLQPVTKKEYDAYVKVLKPFKSTSSGVDELTTDAENYEIDSGSECSSGICPVR